jgi:predicted Zn-dependent protease
LKTRLAIAAVLVVISLVSYYSSGQVNPVTGEHQRVGMNTDQEIAMGLQAAPEMARQHGGLHADPQARARVEAVGQRLVDSLNEHLRESGKENPYDFEFHLLRDPETVNAFALPGGQVFITAALYNRLETEGQLAGVLGHEIGHVLSRHGAQRLAQQKLTQGLAGAAGVAGGDVDSTRMAMAIGNLINMQYGRQDELESDKWGVTLSADAGYDPRAMLGVMRILDEASGGGGGPPEMLSTHPKPANRAAYVEMVLAETFPNGVPNGLEP